jgi:hypothetical protein
MNDLCLRFDSEAEALQVLAATGLLIVTPEHVQSVAAHTVSSWAPIDPAGAIAAQLDAMFSGAEYGDRACIGDVLYERLDDDAGNLVWCAEVRTEVPASERVIPASVRPADGVRLDIVGVITRPVGEPDAEGLQQTEQLPGWHVNALLAGPVPEALQPYVVTPAQRARVWA